MLLGSSAFACGEYIPRRYSGLGGNISPPLEWMKLPEGTKSLTLILEDPDASKTFTHWLIYNIPPDREGLPEAVPTEPNLPDGIRQGLNSAGETGYTGPYPPPNRVHHYHFRLFALDTVLRLKAGNHQTDLIKAMEGHIIDQTDLTGLFVA